MSLIDDRSKFEEHAAPEAISHYIRKAEKRMNAATNEFRWLVDLLKQRNDQIAKGEWPTSQGGEK